MFIESFPCVEHYARPSGNMNVVCKALHLDRDTVSRKVSICFSGFFSPSQVKQDWESRSADNLLEND